LRFNYARCGTFGFIPDDLKSAPDSAVSFLARQLGASAEAVTDYSKRGHTRSDHALEIQSHLGFRKVADEEWIEIERWLTARAMEHDRPLLLLSMLCERLHAAKLVRPGITLLERAVSAARVRAQDEDWRLTALLLNQTDKTNLDRLLVIEESSSVTPLTRYRTGATSYSAASILKVLEKIVELRTLGVERWDIGAFNPNRLKRLAQIGGKATNQILERMQPERRYPILLAFLHQALTKTIDEAIDLFDRNLADSYSRAGRELEEFRRGVAKATNEKVRLFRTVGRILLDPEVKDAEIRSLIYQQIAPDELRHAVDECEQIMRPLDDSYFDLLATRYSTLRQFAPRFLETFTWQSAREDDALLSAIAVLKELNASGARKIPADAPREFIPVKWEPYVIDEDGQTSRRYYELCLLWEMRDALRAGNLWVEGSRRYTNPESYLIPPERGCGSFRTTAKPPKNGLFRKIAAPKQVILLGI
jgi:hypothetical protein